MTPSSTGGGLPSGVVTFLLTDIVGSTRLWERAPDDMSTALLRHDSIIAAAVEANAGIVLKARGEGDSTFSVFQRATDAAAAAVESQRALAQESWPDSCQLRVRMAVHTGEAIERDGDYQGGTVNRVARLRALAEGGQVLLSRATSELIIDHLPADVRLVDLGDRQLRDLERHETVWQLRWQGAGHDEPAGSKTREKHGRVYWIAAAALVVLGLGTLFRGFHGRSATSGSDVTFRIGVPEPAAIDPAVVSSNAGAFITNLLFVSLTTLDTKTNELRPGVAERWERNRACTEWTFHLRPSHFSNGEPVTAAAFVRAYTRLSKKSAGSEVAGFLQSIQGFDDLNSGKSDVLAGLSVLDAHTLRIRTAVDCDFDRETTLSEFSPVPAIAGDARNRKYNLAPIGNGPYQVLGSIIPGRGITLVRNSHYDLGPPPVVGRVEIVFETPERSYEAFVRGERDYARVPLRFITDAQRLYSTHGSFTETKATLDYFYVSVNRQPYDNVLVRRALSLAIDRDRLVRSGLVGGGRPADSIIPPSFGAFYRAGACSYCRHDPVEGRRLASLGGLAPGTKIPIEYAAGERNQAWIALVASDIESALDVKVELLPVAFDENATIRTPGALGLFQHTWEADYPTPTDFLARILATGADGNFLGYSNPSFDDAIAAAITEPKLVRRTEGFAHAEDLALNELPIIPLWYKTILQVANEERFTNVRTNFFDYPVIIEVRTPKRTPDDIARPTVRRVPSQSR